MKVIKVMDGSGDSPLEFSGGDDQATAEARALFERLRAKGYNAFSTNRPDGEADKPVTKFEELEETTIMFTALEGG